MFDQRWWPIMGNAEQFTREIRIEGSNFVFDGTVEINSEHDKPMKKADALVDHLDECLAEYIVSQATE